MKIKGQHNFFLSMCKWVQAASEARGVRSPGVGVTCEPSDIGPGNWTQVLCKSTCFVFVFALL